MGGRFWQYAMVLAVLATLGALACEVLPTAVTEDDFPDEGNDAQAVARDGDEDGCWYLIIYYIDTGEIISRTKLGCSHGGGGSNNNLYVTFGCTENVVRGRTGGCSITTNPSNATLSGEWSFSPDVGRRTTRSGSHTHFRGTAVVSGTLNYSGTVRHSGESEQVGTSTRITVKPRTSYSWTSRAGQFRANGPAGRGVLENCVAWRSGIAADVDTDSRCADFMNEGTPSVSQGSGPWSSLYYIRSHNTSVDVAFQVNLEFRSYASKTFLNGDLQDQCEGQSGSTSRQNEMSANGLSCARPNQYFSALAYLVSHERGHVSAASREWARLDLYENIEALVDPNRVSVRNRATSLISGGHQSLRNAARTHTGRSVSYRYWRRANGSLWEYLLETFPHGG